MPLWAELDPKERGPADELIVLAVTALVKAWKLDGSGKHTHLLQVRVLLRLLRRGCLILCELSLQQATEKSMLACWS